MLFEGFKAKNKNFLEWFFSYFLIAIICVFIFSFIMLNVIITIVENENDTLSNELDFFSKNELSAKTFLENTENDELFFIYDLNNNLIYSNNISKNYILDYASNNDIKSKYFKIKTTSDYYQFTTIKEANNTYIFGKPNHSVHFNSHIILIFLFVAIFFSVFISLVMSLFFSSSHLNKAKSLIKTIENTNYLTPPTSKDIYENIQISLIELSQYYTNIKETHLSNLLKNIFDNNDNSLSSFETLKTQFNINFEQKYFCVCSFRIFDTEKDLYDKKNIKYFVINNVLGEIFEKDFKIYQTKFNEYVVAIICFDSYDYQKEKLQIIGRLDKTIAFLNNNMKIDVTVSLGNIIEDKSEIFKSFNNSQTALLYFKIIGKNKVIDYEYLDIHSEKKLQISKIFKISRKLSSSVLKHDFVSCKSSILEIIELLELSLDTPERMEIQITFINLNFYDILLQQPNSDELINFYTNQFTEYVANKENITVVDVPSIKENMLKTIDFLAETYNKQKYNNSDMTNKIISNIENNYSSLNLSVNKIADDLNILPSTISKAFKNDTGGTILKYIHTYRIEKSKELLSQGMSVKDVAVAVGFENTMTFIRVFKKYEAITPGQFKPK